MSDNIKEVKFGKKEEELTIPIRIILANNEIIDDNISDIGLLPGFEEFIAFWRDEKTFPTYLFSKSEVKAIINREQVTLPEPEEIVEVNV